jgi:type II secretory pathway predicted ATPase ExeA
MEPNYSSLFNDIKVSIYVVLSRSTTFDGLYLFQPIDIAKKDMDLLVESLKARGGMSQLLMFLTGPAGAGKSTAVKVAQRFCFEFCAAVSVMWHDETFYFTACSGSAAALFRGVTIHSGAFLNGRVTDKARKEWKNVRILMIDEISYFSDNDFKKLDRKLKE